MTAESHPILLVEDDHDQRRLFAAVLEGAGYPVTAVENGEEAIQAYRRGDFVLVMTDYYLPDMTGLELLKQLQRMRPLPAAILATASASEEVAFKAEHVGNAAFFRKSGPGKITRELPAVVERVLSDRRRSEAQANMAFTELQGQALASNVLEDGVPRLLVDTQGVVRDVNEAFCTLMQAEREAFLGKHCCEVLPSEGNEDGGECCVAMTALRHNRMVTRTAVRTTTDGEKFQATITAIPMRTQEGRIHSVMVSVVQAGNAELQRSLMRSQSQLELFTTIANTFLAFPGEEAYAEVLSIILTKLKSRYGIFGYIDHEGSLVCPSMTRDIWQQCRMADKSIVLPRKVWGGVWGKVLTERKTILANRSFTPPKGHVPITRFLGTPIVYRDRLIGALFVANKAEDYTEQERDTLESIARYLGPILKARLDRAEEERQREATEEELRTQSAELERQTRQIETMFAITRLAEEFLSVEEFLQRAVRLIPGAFPNVGTVHARLTLHEQTYLSDRFVDTPFVVSAPIFVQDQYVGALEVAVEECDVPTELKEELDRHRPLVEELAERIGSILNAQQATRDAQQLHQRMEMLLEVTNTGMSIMDGQCRMLYVDRNRQKIYGDFRGKTSHEYFCGKDEACWTCAAAKALQTKKRVVVEHNLPRENNRPVQTTAIPYQDENGDWFVAEITVDISERKKMEGHLAQAQKLEAVAHLAAGIAHEINTPTQYVGDNIRFLKDSFGDLDAVIEALNAVHEAAKSGPVPRELLAKADEALEDADLEYLREEIPQAIRQSLDGVERVATIVRAMKEFSHPGSSEKQPVDLNHVLETAAAVSRNEWKYVAELKTEFAPDLPKVPVFTAELNQAVLNIIVNAAHAIADVVEGTETKGTITLATRKIDDNWVEARIGDTGTGIPEELRDKIFNPFFTTKGVGRGTGQGLAIAYNTIVEKHHGVLSFESEVGKGTTFIIRLPVRDLQTDDEAGRDTVLVSALTTDTGD
ncbi:hypothetical protein JCM19992_05010 [Thermostilla marina]